jgi:hypothetical protein
MMGEVIVTFCSNGVHHWSFPLEEGVIYVGGGGMPRRKDVLYFMYKKENIYSSSRYFM